MTRTQDWIFVEGSQERFRKSEIYSLNWNIENTTIYPSCFGGPLAISRDINKPDIRPLISIYSQSGAPLKSFQLEDKSTLIGIGWTCMEDIVLVKKNGEIQIRTMYGQLKTLINITKDSEAIDYRIFNTINTYSGTFTTGIVVRTNKNKFIIVKDVYELKLQQFPELPGSTDVDSWCVISTDKKCFIMASKGNDIFQLTLGGSPQALKPNFNIQFNSFNKLIPSFNNEHLALSTDNGYLILCTSDLNRILHKYNSTEDGEHIQEIAWVADKAVLVYSDSFLLLFPLDGYNPKNLFKMFYGPPVYLVQEIDGASIISEDKTEYLQSVPKPLRDIFDISLNIDPIDASFTLYESSIEFYEKKDQKAEEYIRSIKDKGTLESAIFNCINAAPYEFDPRIQMKLLRAALFGRYFDDYANANPYVKMCKTIRVLNAIRHPLIGIPITYAQYEALTPNVIINRLISRRHFALAIEICKYLNMNNEEGIIKILSNWALYKVGQKEIEDDRIAIMIKSKLGDTPGISYAEIARCAIKAARPGLAIKLLEYETKASEQVPLYIEIDDAELALKKAMESGDSDLIYMVLFWYQSKFHNVSDFMKNISKNSVALNLMLQYYRQKHMTDPDSREFDNILNQENLIMEQVTSTIKVALKQERVDQKVQMIDEARRFFGNDEKFNSGLLSEEAKLLKVQAIIDKNFRIQVTGKSLYETISELIRLNILDEAEKLRKEFKISDTSEIWWHLKARNLSLGGHWEELEKFSKSRKSVIGYEPFVNYCMAVNNQTEAKKYYPKVLPENRFNCLIKMKCLADALDMAQQNKDVVSISKVISKCDPASHRVLIEKAKSIRNELLQR